MAKQSAWETLCKLLEESGARVTFSKNCCSGIVSLLGDGARCECWRCRKGRGEESTDETEAEAARISALAQRAMRDRVIAQAKGRDSL